MSLALPHYSKCPNRTQSVVNFRYAWETITASINYTDQYYNHLRLVVVECVQGDLPGDSELCLCPT
jgi:hypothetical protein